MGELSWDDTADFADADRGFVGALSPGVVKDAGGKVVRDSGAYAFLDQLGPEAANPSPWRQGQLCARQGLYEVTDGIYQVRGLDISNMTLVEGAKGVIVIDPLISGETAAAALGLYRAHRGDRPVTGIIYTHSHGDLFGGVAGVTDGNAPILAPAGHLGVGLGPATPAGTVSLLPPSVHITRTGQQETIDGVRIVFQLTPGTAAPSEMNFLLPNRRALCMAENATHNLHNILTPRGAEVRDARVWSRCLAEALTMFGDQADVLFASHHWPTWGADRIETFLSQQRDLYAYLHEQTLRLFNQGYTSAEIAEMIELPPALGAAWHTRGYYGSVSHNVTGAQELHHGVEKMTAVDMGSGMASALSVEQIFDTLAVRIDARQAWHERISIDWVFTDSGQRLRTTLRRGVLVQQPDPRSGEADLTVTLTKPQLLGMLAGKGLDGVTHEGDPDVLKRLLSHLDEPNPEFAIVSS